MMKKRHNIDQMTTIREGDLAMKLFDKIFEKVPLTVYTITLYASPIISVILMLFFASLFEFFDNSALKSIFSFIVLISPLICFIIYSVIWIVNLIFGAKNAVLPSVNGRTTGKGVLVYKLIQAPYHCLFFLFCLVWVLGAYNPFLIWTYIFLPLAVVHSFGVMLSTSIYGISRAVRLKRDGVISKRKATVIIILLLIFVLDFFGAAELIHAEKNRPEAPSYPQ